MAGCAGENRPLPATAQGALAHKSNFSVASRKAPPLLYVENLARHPTVTVYRVGTEQLRLTIPISRPLCGASMVLDNMGTLYVATVGAIAVFSGPKKSASYITQGINQPSALALDSEQNLYVANETGGVEEFSPGGKQLLRTITDGVETASALAIDSTDNLYVANWPRSGSPSVTVYLNGASDPSETITDGVVKPRVLAVDSKQTLYVSNGNNVTAYSLGSVSPSETLTFPYGVEPGTALAIDKYGRLFVGGKSSVAVYKPGSAAVYRTVNQITPINALATDRGGRLYTANSTHKHNGKSEGGVWISPPGYLQPTLRIGQKGGVRDPIALAVGPR